MELIAECHRHTILRTHDDKICYTYKHRLCKLQIEMVRKLIVNCGAVNTAANLRALIGYVKFSSPAFPKVDRVFLN